MTPRCDSPGWDSFPKSSTAQRLQIWLLAGGPVEPAFPVRSVCRGSEQRDLHGCRGPQEGFGPSIFSSVSSSSLNRRMSLMMLGSLFSWSPSDLPHCIAGTRVMAETIPRRLQRADARLELMMTQPTETKQADSWVHERTITQLRSDYENTTHFVPSVCLPVDPDRDMHDASLRSCASATL